MVQLIHADLKLATMVTDSCNVMADSVTLRNLFVELYFTANAL